MALRLRVCLSDRPGALGRLTTMMGQLGADVHQVSVLAREGGRAWDDLLVSWPERRPLGDLQAALTALPGVEVEGLWQTLDVPGSHPELDVLRQAAADPDRAVRTVVDALPGMTGSRWALVVEPGPGALVVRHRSADVPQDAPGEDFADLLSVDRPGRPVAGTRGGQHAAVLPLGEEGFVVLVVRGSDAAPFHPLELAWLEGLMAVTDVAAHTPVRV